MTKNVSIILAFLQNFLNFVACLKKNLPITAINYLQTLLSNKHRNLRISNKKHKKSCIYYQDVENVDLSLINYITLYSRGAQYVILIVTEVWQTIQLGYFVLCVKWLKIVKTLVKLHKNIKSKCVFHYSKISKIYIDTNFFLFNIVIKI